MMEKIKSFVIDLSKTKGSGEFGCPECGVKISPDDQSDDVFTVLEPVMKEGQVEKIIIRCNRCGSEIHLTGFHVLRK
jgi:uncharacterized protein with PIN domain